MRLVNYVRGVVRSTEAAPDAICDALKVALEPSRIDAGAPLWGDDALLAPVLADDGLILAVLGDNASENEEPTRNTPALVCSEAHVDEDAPRASDSDAAATIAALSAELASARNLMERLVAGADDGLSSDSDESVSSENGRRNTRRRKRAADNDTYYFDSEFTGSDSIRSKHDVLRASVLTDNVTQVQSLLSIIPHLPRSQATHSYLSTATCSAMPCARTRIATQSRESSVG